MLMLFLQPFRRIIPTLEASFGRSKVEMEAQPLLLPPPDTRGQRKTLQLYTCFNLVDMVH